MSLEAHGKIRGKPNQPCNYLNRGHKSNVIIGGQLFLIARIMKTCIVIEPRHEKTGFCICENKAADQMYGQRPCFRYTDGTIPLLPKSEISSI